MKKRNVVVVGGGASGLMAAITAVKNGANVTILEHKDRVGKKILMTGNGKCNLTNLNDYHDKYYSDDIEKAYEILDSFTPNDTIDFFKRVGLYTKEKRDGGIYPLSEQAASVLDVLRLTSEQLGIKTILMAEIIDLNFDNKSILIKVDDKKSTLLFDKVIIATGGKAASVAGSDGSGYSYAKKLGLHIIKPLPALVQLRCEGNFFKSINGVRVESRLSMYIDGDYICSEKGELQLTDYGISGIPVFQISRYASKALDKKKKVSVSIDFLPEFTEDDINQIFTDKDAFGYKTLEEYLNGLLNKKLSVMLCKQMGYDLNISLDKISNKEFRKIINNIRDFSVTVKETNSFEQAQVTCGGVSLKDIDTTMTCKNNHDVYFAGEILDCDGICGGYNLQWAWATGYIAGYNASLL